MERHSACDRNNTMTLARAATCSQRGCLCDFATRRPSRCTGTLKRYFMGTYTFVDCAVPVLPIILKLTRAPNIQSVASSYHLIITVSFGSSFVAKPDDSLTTSNDLFILFVVRLTSRSVRHIGNHSPESSSLITPKLWIVLRRYAIGTMASSFAPYQDAPEM